MAFTSIIYIEPYLSFGVIRKMSNRSRVWLRFSSCPTARMPCEPHIPDGSLSGGCLERKTYATNLSRTAYMTSFCRYGRKVQHNHAGPTLLVRNLQFLSVDARTKRETVTVTVTHTAIVWVIPLLRMVNTSVAAEYCVYIFLRLYSNGPTFICVVGI